MARAVEFLIVGQGLAGTALAWELLWRGGEVLVVDPGDPITSSRIAAGLVTPITGQRLALSWRVDAMLEAARAFYDRVAMEVRARHFHPRIVRRIFRSSHEAAVWAQRQAEPERQPHIARAWVPDAGPFGGCEFHGAHLDCAGYLVASRDFFRQHGCLLETRLEAREAAEWPAAHVVFCQGFDAARHPPFDWIRWRAAKGEILTVRTSGLDPGRILSAGQWVVPVAAPGAAAGPGHQFARTGSTYDWDVLDTHPTDAARRQLEAGFASLHPAPFEVIGHHAAVRPIIRESRAVIGRHPAREKLAIFNGLGSKGSLHAPFFARQLAAHLTEGSPIEDESDVRRNAG